MAKGGTKISYYLAKYLKLVLSNAVLIGTIYLFITPQKINIPGAFEVCILWIFVCPFFILAFNNALLIQSEGDIEDLIINFRQYGVTYVVLAIVYAGTVAYSQSNFEVIAGVYYANSFFPPLVLFEAIESGFLY